MQPQSSPAVYITKLSCNCTVSPTLIRPGRNYCFMSDLKPIVSDPPVHGTLFLITEILTTVLGGRRGTRQGKQRKYFRFAPPLNNHNANPKDSPERDAMRSLFSITCWFWLILGRGRVHLTIIFHLCLHLGLAWADGKLILLYSNPGKLY